MIVLKSNNPEESQIGWFAYVPKNRVNFENWKLVCEHLNNLEISKEDTLYLPSSFDWNFTNLGVEWVLG